MVEDSELLLRYADSHSESAFAQFVEQNIGLVYYAALRRTNGYTHLAEDVAQIVFTTAARDARSVARHPVPAGWLYVTTRNAAANLMRAQKRRRERELEAVAMQPNPVVPGSNIDAERLRGEVTSAMDSLDDGDRRAVLLRYFKDRPYSELAGSLGISEQAARKRVERALEKLRALLSERGIEAAALALATQLDAEAGENHPFRSRRAPQRPIGFCRHPYPVLSFFKYG